MHPRSPAIIFAAALSTVAFAAAGCGSGYSSGDSSTTPAAPETSAPSAGAGSGGSTGAATIDVADNSDLGQILSDGDGNTVYLFEKDEADESYCSGECAAAWPPVTTSGDASAGSGADQSLISTIQRDDGSEQVTYDGHPLYLFAGDSEPGDTSGNELDQFGAEWYAITPDGSNAESSGSSGSSGSTDSTSGGYSTY